MPTYPFQRQRYWLTPAPATPAVAGLRPLIDRQMRLPAQQQVVFEKAFSTTTLPFLADHAVYDEVVVPGACHLAFALSAAELLGQSPCVLQDVVFPQALTLPADSTLTVQCVTTAPAADDAIPATTFRILSFAESDPTSTAPLTHASGHLLSTPPVAPAIDLAALQARCDTPLAADGFYAALAEAHVALGPQFRWLHTIGRHEGQGEAIARLQQPAAVSTQGYALFPALIDAMFQLAAAAMLDQTRTTGQLATLLPFALETFTFYAAPPAQVSLWCHVVQGADQRWAITLFTETGQVLATVEGFA
ncbi:MAG: polyketide synthase dehydratase domain-containing protein [Caldilineaceae bacterium]